MPKSKEQRQNLTISALSEWKKAGEKLATALSAYHQSCTTLVSFSNPQSPESHVIASRIDQSLKGLHIKLFDELSQSRVVLARMRNQISSQAHLLPNEVLAKIFQLVVYTPGPEDRYTIPMPKELKRMFRRLHSLLGVCSTWRNIGVTLSELWSVIPVAGKKSKLFTPTATSLIIERSQALISTNLRQVHLAVVLSDRFATNSPLATTRVPQFTSINIEAQIDSPICDISALLERLTRSQAPEVLSELSIHHYHDRRKNPQRPRIPFENEFIGRHMLPANRPLFFCLIRSLSIFRLRGVNIEWSTVTFSNKLVHLHLQDLVLGDHSKLTGFLRVLESAPELRDLKIISVVAFKHRHRDAPVVKVSLPNLQSLLLDDLSFNVISHILTSIPPGSHQLKVGLTRKAVATRYLEVESEDDEFEYDDDDYELGEEDITFEEEFGTEDVLSLLNRSNIDTLFLDTRCRNTPYMSRTWLHSVLKSLPCLKTLILQGWKWYLVGVLGLERPAGNSFPSLTTLYIIDNYLIEIRHLARVIASHPLQTLVLGNSSVKDENNPVFQRLKQQVPDFRLDTSLRCVFDFSYGTWRLW